MSNLASKMTIFTNMSWYLTDRLTRLFGALFIGTWLARYLGPEGYGLLAYAQAIVATVGILGSWGLESLIVRDLVHQDSNKRKVLSTYFFIRLLGALLVPCVVLAYAKITHPENQVLLLLVLIFSSTIILSSLDATDCWLQSQQQAKRNSIIRLQGFILSTLAKAILIAWGASIEWFALTSLLEAMIVAGHYLLVLRRQNLTPTIAYWSFNECKRLFKDGRLMILSAVTVVAYSKIDVLIVGSLLSAEALGSYAIAATMCAAWNLVGTVLVQAWAPRITLAHAKGIDTYILSLRRLLALVFTVAVTGSATLALGSPWFFETFLGPEYASAERVFSILVWSAVPIFVGVATSQIIVNERLYWVSLLRTSVGMLISFVAIVPISMRWDVRGVASLVVVSALVATCSILFSSSARRTFSMILGNRNEVKN